MPIRKKCRFLLQDIVQKVTRENKRHISLSYTNNLFNQPTFLTQSGKLSPISCGGQKENCSSFTHCIYSGVLRRAFSTGSFSRMRFVQFSGTRGGRGGSPPRLGVQLTQESDIIDVSGVDSSIPNSLVQLLRAGPEMLEKSKR
jgi:hypothetical protein